MVLLPNQTGPPNKLFGVLVKTSCSDFPPNPLMAKSGKLMLPVSEFPNKVIESREAYPALIEGREPSRLLLCRST